MVESRNHSFPEKNLAGPRPRRRLKWKSCLLALGLTLGTFWVRLMLAPLTGDSPTLIVFIIPILISAYTGGLLPGLVATSSAALLTNYFLLPPLHSFAIAKTSNLIPWMILIVIGTLTSVLMESLQGAKEAAMFRARQYGKPATERKVRTGFALALVCLGAIGIASFASINRFRDDAEWVQHSQSVIGSLHRLSGLAEGAETLQRGFLITSNETFLADFTNAVEDAESELASLRKLTADNPEQQTRLETLDTALHERVERLFSVINLARTQGSGAASEAVASGAGHTLQGRVRTLIVQAENHEKSLLFRRDAEADHSGEIAQTGIVIGSLLGFALCTVALFLIGRDFAQAREAEAELRRSRDELEQRVQQRTAELTSTIKSLRENELLLRTVTDNSGLGLVMVNRDHRYEFTNAAYSEILRLNESHLIGKRIADVLPGLYEKQIRPRLQRAFEGERVTYELLLPRLPGQTYERVFAVSYVPRLIDGRVEQVVVVIYEITERKQTERQLSLQAVAMTTAIDGIMITDRAGHIVWVNPAFEKLTGYALAEVQGQRPNLLKSGQHDAQFYGEIWQTLLAGHPWEGDFVNRRKDGSLYHAHASMTAVRAGGSADITHFLAVQEDITQRKAAEAALRQSEEQLETVIENMSEGLVVSKLDGQLIHWNHSAVAMHGFASREEGLRALPEFTRVFELSTLDGAVMPLEQWPLVRVLRDEVLRNLELHIRKIGQDWDRIFSYSGAIIITKGGDKLAFLTITDVTELKAAELKLRSFASRLTAAIETQRDIAAADTDLPGLQQLILERLLQLTGAEGACFEVTKGDEMVYEAVSGMAKQFSGFRLKKTGSVSGLCVSTGQMQRVEDTETDPRVDRAACRRIGVRSLIVIPLRYGGDLFGVLKLMSDRVAAFDAASEHTLRLMDQFISATIARKRSEDTLAASEERLRMFVQHAPAAIVMFDRDMRYLAASRRFQSDYGLTWEVMRGRSHYELFPEIPERWKKLHQRSLAGETLRCDEDRFNRADGSVQWLKWEMLPWRDAFNNVAGIMLFTDDITERKAAEDQKAHLAALVESSEDAIISKTLDGIITTWNRGAEKMFGYSAAEAINQPVLLIFPPDRAGEEGDILARIARGETLRHYETQRIRKNGTIMDVSVTISPIRDSSGKIVGASKIARDITERLAAVKSLNESQSRLSGLVSAAMDPIISIDSSQRIILFNTAAEKAFLCSAAEAIGQPIDRFIPERFRHAHRQHVKRFGETGETTRAMNALGAVSGVRSNGEEFPIEASISQISLGGEKLYTVILRDITQRKKHEMEIQQLNADLENRVAQRTAQLEMANHELEAFSYSVSHDLRAPLRAVNGFAGIVVEDYGSLLPPEGRAQLERIRNAGRRMGELIDDLLNFSRLSRHPLSRRTVDTEHLVREVLAELQPLHEGRALDLRIGKLPNCSGDPALLRQVWVNLLSNAIKYTRGRNPAAVEIGCDGKDGTPIYFVRDNGTGFDMKYADKLFGVFQRLHRSEEFEGTGVGLAIVQRVINRHGGRVWAEAKEGQGATFYFTLDPTNNT